MDLKTLALAMYPYWILGAVILIITILAGHKNVVRVEKDAVFKWAKFLLIVTVYRFILFKIFPHWSLFTEAQKNITMIPWPLTFTVFWEDACHGLPLYLLQQWTGMEKRWAKVLNYVLMGLVMIEFGAGHLYQGMLAAAFLMLYVPYSIKYGKKFGFGTVMICHTLFDLTTILSFKYLFGP